MVAATEFLSKANPLAHVAAVRKSQVQHALAEMLASILQPTVEAGMPRCLPPLLSSHPLPRFKGSRDLFTPGHHGCGVSHAALCRAHAAPLVTLPL